jgi:hypothetical protein
MGTAEEVQLQADPDPVIVFICISLTFISEFVRVFRLMNQFGNDTIGKVFLIRSILFYEIQQMHRLKRRDSCPG